MRVLLPIALLASPALGQEAPPEAAIVITGRGLPQGIGEDAYGGVTLDRERLTSSASGRLDEILKDVPGFALFRRSDARSANPTSQGATLRGLGGNASSRALLILDGVPQSDPFGGWISWPAYDPERLGSVRITRGGGSGANGPGALAGTVELSSAGPDDLRGGRAGLFYGSRDSVDAFGGVGADLGAGFGSISARYGRGDGFVPVIASQRGPADISAPYEQTSIALRGVAPVGGAELQASALWFRDERARGAAFSDISTQGADGSLRLVGPRWAATAYVQLRDFSNSFASVNAARTAASQVADQYHVPATGLGARVEARPRLGPVEIRVGGDWRETVGETRERFNFQNGVGTRGREAGGRTRTLGAFAEAGWEQGDLTLTGGGRIDRWWIEDGFLDERVFATGQVLNALRYPDRQGWEPTARAALAWRPAGAITLRGAAYTGWRLPTLNELYRPFRIGPDATAANPELAPERLRGVEAGIDYRPLSTARLGLTVFANRLVDPIANVTLDTGPGVFPGVGFVGASGEYRQRRNLDAIAARGVEIDAALDIGAWSLSGGYAYVDSEVASDGAAAALDGRRPAQTPAHSASATLGWRGLSDARASLTARYVGAQFEDDLNQQSLPDALTLDAFASAPIGRGWRVEARAENLFDARVVAGISGAGIVERATPRTLWIGLRYAPS